LHQEVNFLMHEQYIRNNVFHVHHTTMSLDLSTPSALIDDNTPHVHTPSVEKRVYDTVMEMVHKAPYSEELRASLSVALAREAGVSSYGKRNYDTLGTEAGEQPAHLDMAPYGRTGAGSTVAVTATDPKTHEVYVLLGRKYKDPNHPELGLGDYIMPGGYINPKPPTGANAADLVQYDTNLHETAARELFEETGYRLPENYHMKSLGVNSDITGNKDLHTINEFFHVNVPQHPSQFPAPVAADDLAMVEWVRARDIVKDPTVSAQPDGSAQSRYSVQNAESTSVNIRDLHGEYIDKAVAAVRQETLELYTHRLNALGIRPAMVETALGEVAHTKHDAMMAQLNSPTSRSPWQQMLTQGQERQAALSGSRLG
jgi:8-oxo-dGTP pyrophosphatase MutT (NUDIX family)